MLVFELIALVALLSLSALFSGSETALFSLTGAQRARIRARSAADDARIASCMANSAALLSTLLVGNTFVNFAAATLGYLVLSACVPRGGGALAVPVMTILLLAFGEITPKRLALRYGESVAPVCARVMLFLMAVLKPLTVFFQFSSRAYAKALTRERRALSDAELVSVLETAAESGEFALEDEKMVEGVLRLSELHANDEMTPRVDIEGYDSDLPPETRAVALAAARHHYLPVYNRTPDAIEGVYDTRTGRRLDALFVPEQATLDDLLMTFRKSRLPLAIVTDEFGGTAGLITLTDIMELIVGPDVLGHRDIEPLIRRESERVWTIDADASLDEINRTIGLELAAEDADRLAGWIAAQVERIPHVGQVIEAQGCRLTILKRRKHRVETAKLEVLEFPKPDTDAELIAETDEAVEKTREDME